MTFLVHFLALLTVILVLLTVMCTTQIISISSPNMTKHIKLIKLKDHIDINLLKDITFFSFEHYL